MIESVTTAIRPLYSPVNERFLGEFVQSIKASLQRGTQDISEHPWTGIFIEKVKQCKRKPEYVMEWITDYVVLPGVA